MGILDTIKSALGIGSSRDKELDPASERAVKEPAAAGTDASGSTGSVVEESSSAAAAEAAEAAGPGAADPDEAGEKRDVEAVSGIGPAYASRLADAGVDSVADLLEADADTLAEETGISAKRIGRWQDDAAEL
ncbi:helix-hairpin-helix domain-containing protein [Halosegnis sp.]|uniref:helix-hairpin-helix domain-containing protein n=1 Tax=Halosegnis sp. TaxID=2864959 RepID=UPI0035D49347